MNNFIKSSILLVGFLTAGIVNAQINITTVPDVNNIPNGTPFLDASSYYNASVSGSNDIGKGLVFPQVDLVNFQFNVTQPDGATVLPTWYDGMVVYNTVSGTTLTNGNRSLTATDVTPGFYYFSNPTGVNDGAITNGKWVRLGADAATAQAALNAWQLGGNTNATATNNLLGTLNANDVKVVTDAAANTRMQIGAGLNADATRDATFSKVIIAPNAATTMAKTKTVPVNPAAGQTTAPFDFVLEVGGKAWFTDGIVTNTSTYPDYVFDKYFTGKSEENDKYNFLTLAQTEKFIKENNHLPGVTSIKELTKANGAYEVDNTKLSIQTLEKVEELYLHTIEQQKQIDALKAEIAALKANKK